MNSLARLAAILCAIAAPCVTHAGVVAEYRGAFVKSETRSESFPFEIADAQREYGIGVTAILDTGSGSLRVIGSGGGVVYQHSWGERYSQQHRRLVIPATGTYTIAVDATSATGQWRARIVALPDRASLRWAYLSAALVMVIPVVVVIAAHRRGAHVRYAAVGAGILVLGRLIWFSAALVLEIGARYALEDNMPYRAFLWTQSVILGAWQGVAAMLAVMLAARIVKPLLDRPENAVAAGVGTAATEMIVSGVLTFMGLAVMFGGGPRSDTAQFNQAYEMAVTPLSILADPTIQVIQGVCTVAATLLIAHGLRSRRVAGALEGGAIFAAVLTAVSASRTIALFGPESRWIVLAVVLPVAALSAIMVRRNLATWAERPVAGETALDAFVRAQGGDGGE